MNLDIGSINALTEKHITEILSGALVIPRSKYGFVLLQGCKSFGLRSLNYATKLSGGCQDFSGFDENLEFSINVVFSADEYCGRRPFSVFENQST